MYDFSVRNLRYVVRTLDADHDGWPEGLGNVERTGMGPEKLDNTVYFIRGLYDLADMAQVQARRGDPHLGTEPGRAAARALRRHLVVRGSVAVRRLAERAGQHPVLPEALDRPDADGGRAARQRPDRARAGAVRPRDAALAGRENPCYSGTPPFNPGSVPHRLRRRARTARARRSIFGLTTSIQSIGEGNYGRLGPGQQQRYTHALAETMFSEPATGGTPDEQPGAMPEIFPSPDQGANIDRCWTCRSMFMQAWGNYGTAWAVVHQWLGVRPDLGHGRLDVVPQVPQGQTSVRGRDIRLGDGSVDVRATHDGNRYRTEIDVGSRVGATKINIGHTLPTGAQVSAVVLDGKQVKQFLTRAHQPWNRGDSRDGRRPSHAGHHHLNQARRMPPDDEEDEMRSWLRRAVPILLGVALLAVPSAASGDEGGSGAARHSLRAPLTAENFYFLMADRFENGRTANDLGGLPADRLHVGLRPDRQGLLPRRRPRRDPPAPDATSAASGTTAIWLTPSFKNKAVQLEDGPSAGYHGYWITDFTQIDPHLGTNAELAALIDEAHGMGMKVFFDIITNHTADVIDYEEGSPARLRLQGPGALPRPRRASRSTTATSPARTTFPPLSRDGELPLHAVRPGRRSRSRCRTG